VAPHHGVPLALPRETSTTRLNSARCMSAHIATSLQDYFAATVRVPADLADVHRRYTTAKPFPHIVLDDLFDPSLLDRVIEEAPSPKSASWLAIEQDGLESTLRMRSAMEIGAAGREMVATLSSAAFLYMVSEMTGIWQLLPDPYLQGAGHAAMLRGDFFKVHSDRTVAYDTGLTRRLAVITFLNKDWPSAEYGGNLELWNNEGTRCEVSIEPQYNRTIIFEIAHPNYHGVPQPLTCPANVTRRSFMFYYHTVDVGVTDKVSPHTSRFAPQFYRPKKSALHRALVQLTPPIVTSALAKAFGKRS